MMLLAGTSASAGALLKPKGDSPSTAKEGARKARITWNPVRVIRTVQAGQTLQVEATFTSSADLAQVTVRVPGGLGRFVTVAPTSFASVKAGTPTKVTLTVTMPAEQAYSQGGVVQLRAGKRNLPQALKVQLNPGASDGTDADPQGDDKGKPKDKPTGSQGKPEKTK